MKIKFDGINATFKLGNAASIDDRYIDDHLRKHDESINDLEFDYSLNSMEIEFEATELPEIIKAAANIIKHQAKEKIECS